ncbi:MAG: leucine-rich repeat protein [Clostridia bacterium]|nr:leucine-rich repeat protein [Clostridia bacterium]
MNINDFDIDNGVLKQYSGKGGDVIVPEGVTSIGDNAFRNCHDLTSVTVPLGVTAIGNNAFEYCTSLSRVSLPDSITHIGSQAFQYCFELKEIEIPTGVNRIDYGTFRSCRGLTSIRIPRGVTVIGKNAFQNCSALTSVNVPDGVTSIGWNAFYDCKSLKSVTVPASVTTVALGAFDIDLFGSLQEFRYLGTAAQWCGVSLARAIKADSFYFGNQKAEGELVIPDGVTSIGNFTFYGFKDLTAVSIPQSVMSIGEKAFCDCERLARFTIPTGAAMLNKDVFGDELPIALASSADSFFRNMTDPAVKQYLLRESVWNALDVAVRTAIFTEKQSKLKPASFTATAGNDAALGESLLALLDGNPSASEYNAVAAYMKIALNHVPDTLLQDIYGKLKTVKTAKKALGTIEKNTELFNRCQISENSQKKLPPIERKLAEILKNEKISSEDLEKRLKLYYSLTPKSLPTVFCKDQSPAPAVAIVWLLTAHESIKREEVFADHPTPGIRPEAKTLLEELDPQSMQTALMRLADENLGLMGRSKKMFLAYPICRYADAQTMRELLSRAPRWSSSTSGNDAPALYTFRLACLYSEEHAVSFFADRFHDLAQYARIRGTTEDEIRDRYLSDSGLSPDGTKEYDLGNQTVTVRLKKDLSFTVEQSNGKQTKSLPKKGADPALYETANADFSTMKKNVGKIVKNRIANLFSQFLDHHVRSAQAWRAAYLENPLLRAVASTLVWEQGKRTFTVCERELVNADGTPYALAECGDISLAHPMEMMSDEVVAWQKYFTSRAIKQPFMQIWEPVIPADSIAKDRYRGCMIPYYRFLNQGKHGIFVQDYDYHDMIVISFADCKADVKWIDQTYHMVTPDDRFEIESFEPSPYSRRSNHIAAYLDRITVYGRILNDDVSVRENLETFTLAQIMDFIGLASENNCVNVTAMLMAYKNEHFSDFDPMDEFVLDD